MLKLDLSTTEEKFLRLYQNPARSYFIEVTEQWIIASSNLAFAMIPNTNSQGVGFYGHNLEKLDETYTTNGYIFVHPDSFYTAYAVSNLSDLKTCKKQDTQPVSLVCCDATKTVTFNLDPTASFSKTASYHVYKALKLFKCDISLYHGVFWNVPIYFQGANGWRLYTGLHKNSNLPHLESDLITYKDYINTQSFNEHTLFPWDRYDTQPIQNLSDCHQLVREFENKLISLKVSFDGIEYILYPDHFSIECAHSIGDTVTAIITCRNTSHPLHNFNVQLLEQTNYCNT